MFILVLKSRYSGAPIMEYFVGKFNDELIDFNDRIKDSGYTLESLKKTFGQHGIIGSNQRYKTVCEALALYFDSYSDAKEKAKKINSNPDDFNVTVIEI